MSLARGWIDGGFSIIALFSSSAFHCIGSEGETHPHPHSHLSLKHMEQKIKFAHRV